MKNLRIWKFSYKKFIGLPTEDERWLRLLTIKKFSTVIEKLYPGCYVVPQGSTANDTYMPTSDIDLVIMNSGEEISVLTHLSRVFKKMGLVSSYQVIANARVPITKLVETSFGFHIDLLCSEKTGPGHIN